MKEKINLSNYSSLVGLPISIFIQLNGSETFNQTIRNSASSMIIIEEYKRIK